MQESIKNDIISSDIYIYSFLTKQTNDKRINCSNLRSCVGYLIYDSQQKVKLQRGSHSNNSDLADSSCTYYKRTNLTKTNMKLNIKTGIILGILSAFLIGIAVYAWNDPIAQLGKSYDATFNVLKEQQATLREMEHKVAEQKRIEKRTRKELCEIMVRKAKLKLEFEPLTNEDGERLMNITRLDCGNWNIDTLGTFYSTPSDLFYTFLKADGTYVSQTFQQHFFRNKYMALDIATGGRKLNVYAPSYMPLPNTDEEREYKVKIIKNRDTTGLTVLLQWKEGEVNMEYLLGHFSRVDVKDGQKVKTGDKLGVSGGMVDEKLYNEATTGAHLHFEYHIEGISVPYPSWNYTIHYGENGKPGFGEYLGKWKITTYYTPTRDQKSYLYGTYEKDFEINCSGDCLVTGSGYNLKPEDKGKIVACPKEYSYGTKFYIEGVGETRCEDRGGMINGKHLDLWQGIGDDAEIGKGSSNGADVYLIN